MSVGGGPSLDTLQLWILTTVVESPWYFPVLTSAERYSRQTNYRIPDVTPDALLQAVELLFRSDCLSAERGKDRVNWKDVDQLKEWIHGPDPDDFRSMTYFGLTPAGGALWERACEADWSRYISGLGSKSLKDVDGEVFTTYWHHEGASPERLWEFLWREDIRHWNTRLKSRGRELRPWKATYWKTLPTGYRLSTKVRHGTEESKAIWLATKGKLSRGEYSEWYREPA